MPVRYFRELHRQVQIAADTGRAVVDLAGLRLGRGDVVRQRLHRLRRMHHQHVRHRDHLRDRREIAQHVIGQLLVDQMIDRDRAGAEQQRVAVGRRAHHGVDAERVAGAAAVLDIELLAQHLAQVLRDTCARVVSAVPPGAVGTRILTGLFGQGACACAPAVDKSRAANDRSDLSNHDVFTLFSLNVCGAARCPPISPVRI